MSGKADQHVEITSVIHDLLEAGTALLSHASPLPDGPAEAWRHASARARALVAQADAGLRRIYLVAYLDDEGPFAAAFSTASAAQSFAEHMGEQVIESLVDEHHD